MILQRGGRAWLRPFLATMALGLLVAAGVWDVDPWLPLAVVLTAALGCLAPRFDALVMVKPQFEVGPGRVGKNGVVRDPEERRAAIVDVAASAYATVLGFASSGLAGPKGNRETFVWLAEPGRPGGVADVEAAVRDVDP